MKKLLALGAGLTLLCGVAFAQSVSVPTLQNVGPTDLFQDQVGGQPNVNGRYATAPQINGPLGLQYAVPLTAFTLQFNNGTSYYIIKPAGTLATGTFTFDPLASNGQRACVYSTATQTAVTITAGTGQTIGGSAVTAMVAATTYCWIYVAQTGVWYPQTD
jgi:hypothetical protein